MFSDPFYQTQDSEIFVQTRCMRHEHAIHNFLASMLENLGYHQTGSLKRQWERSQKKDFYFLQKYAIVIFADSFGLLGNDPIDPEQWFNKNTVVITDNHVLFKPQYKIHQTPSSYFGIFSYSPKNQTFSPQRRFGLSVNRFDSQRQTILLELLRQSGGIDAVLKNDYINFNVWNPAGTNDTVEDIQKTFATSWDTLKESIPQYQQYYDQALPQLPIKNHKFTIEQVAVSAFLTLVIETYADNSVIALSEKIFRALVTPAPWIVYAAPGTVNYLRSLGFDVLDDLVDHSYDTVNTNGEPSTKAVEYITSGFANYQNVHKQSVSSLSSRCLKAAQHNQDVLKRMKQQWPADFAAWLPRVISELQ